MADHTQQRITNEVGCPRPSDVARGHPLFPMIEYVAHTVCKQETRIKKIEDDVKNVKKLQDELKGLIESNFKKSFNLKDKGYEERLRVGTAVLFTDSLFREADDKSIEAVVKKVLSDETSGKEYKIGIAIKFVKNKLSTFRSEEKRRVLGQPPCGKYAKMATSTLSDAMMKYTKAIPSESRKKRYTRNLILLRKFARENTLTRDEQFFSAFKDWACKTYLNNGIPNEAEWSALTEADEQYPYTGTVIEDQLQLSDHETFRDDDF